MIKLEDETGEFELSLYGSEFALAFRGDPDFMRRTTNLIVNYGIGRSSIGARKFYKPKENKVYEGCSYVLTSMENLMKGLTMYFMAQVILDKEIEVAKIYDDEGDYLDSTWDEERQFELGYAKAVAFYEKRIKHDNFMFGISSAGLDILRYSPQGGDSEDEG
jgi:hypothetical protein